MEVYIGLCIIGGVYCALLFFDIFFKSCAHYPYVKLLDGFGLQINFLSLKWNTKAFNRMLIRWGNSRPQFWKLWFNVGVYTSLALLPISLCLMCHSVYQHFFSPDDKNVIVLEAVVPGINLPLSELGYYSATLLICSVLHEMGHALAAILEDVYVVDVGCYVFFILPVAFVNISSEKFSSISYRRTLRILCAGVWHNIVLTFLAFLVYCCLPYLFLPLYSTGNGVTISYIQNSSPLVGPKGLNVGDIIEKINDCTVYDEDSWYECLKSIDQDKLAFCVESTFIHDFDESIPLKVFDNGYVECCDPSNNQNLCFEYLAVVDILEFPSHVCLPARKVIDEFPTHCMSEPFSCANNMHCFRPVLANNTNLIKITCNTKTVLYVGLVNDIRWSTGVSSFTSKGFLTSSFFPDVVTRLLKYLMVISFGLAFLNILPIMFMDGQHIAQTLGFVLLKNRWEKSEVKVITSVVTWLCTLFFGIYLVYSVSKLLV